MRQDKPEWEPTDHGDEPYATWPLVAIGVFIGLTLGAVLATVAGCPV